MTALRVVRGTLLLLLLGAAAVLGATTAVSLGLPGPLPSSLGVAEGVLLVLVTGVGYVVAAYSERNLQGQPGLTRYAGLVLAVVLSLSAVIAIPSLVVLALGWTVASHAMAGLTGHSGTEQARRAARLVRRRLVVGDLLLWSGVLVTGLWLGAWDRTQLAAAVADGPTLAVSVAALLVVAAMVVRSALVPAHRWLPETAEAPSPVSALLHAGFVNGVGVLALLLWPLAQVTQARVALLLVGLLTVFVGAAQVRTRADVKGRLAASTSSQMGYLSLQVALGIPTAVVAHVVGHGVWKAHKFLAAGGAVQRVRTAHIVPSRRVRIGSTLVAASASIVVVAVAAFVPLAGWDRLAAPADVLPLLMAISVTTLALVTIGRSSVSKGARRWALGAAATGAAGYVLALRVLGHLLEPAFPAPAPWASTEGWTLVAVVAALVIAAMVWFQVDRAASQGRLPRLVRRVARQSLEPRRFDEWIGLGRRRSADVVSPPTVTADNATQAQIDVACASTATLYPLTSFVASNPLSGAEGLGFTDAHQLAADVSGATPGPAATSLRVALERGDITEDDLDEVLDSSSLLERHVALSGRTVDLRDVVRQLLLDDAPDETRIASVAHALRAADAPASRSVRTPLETVDDELTDARVRALGHHLCARALAGTGWTGAADPWSELRAHGRMLDGLLHIRGAARAVAELPAEPVAAVTVLLDLMSVAPADRAPLIARLLGRDPGWPAFLTWRMRNAELGRAAGIQGGDVEDLRPALVATRLTLEWIAATAGTRRRLGRAVHSDDLVSWSHEPLARLLSAPAFTALDVDRLGKDDLLTLANAVSPFTEAELATLRTEVFDASLRRRLLPGLAATTSGRGSREQDSATREQVDAQLVFCIDVRSERLRRHLEKRGPWETLGAAGFFGLPVRHLDLDGSVSERTPALLRPSATVRERGSAPENPPHGVLDALARAVSVIESNSVLVLGWAEAAGWGLAPMVGLATRLPERAARARAAVRRHLGAATIGRLAVTDDVDVDVLAEAAAGFLTAHGLTDPAGLVLLVGHGATVTNNPHVAAYDCGACGGAAGDVSARVMVATLNDERVRAALTARGLAIPRSTRFIAALHDTTTDDVRLLGDDVDEQDDVLTRLVVDLRLAGDDVLRERLGLLPGASPAARPRTVAERRAHDWAQPRPEWGLAGAAAMIVGPRSLSRDVDLQGRVFLQSYRPDHDDTGAVLASLLEAPVVVAHWITSQYRASTVEPHRFGAGDKTTHNVVGHGHDLTAVISGARGDLRLGLPWQAVSPVAPASADGGRCGPWPTQTQHVPGRLVVVVSASVDLVEKALALSPGAAQLVTGSWICLCSVDPGDGAVRRRQPDGTWVVQAPAPRWDQRLLEAA